MKIDVTLTDKEGRVFTGSMELTAASGSGQARAGLVKRRLKRPTGKASPEGLGGHVLGLRDKGFFKKPQVAAEVRSALEATYPCDLNRVEVALLRMQRRKELRKTSKALGGKTKVAYVW